MSSNEKDNETGVVIVAGAVVLLAIVGAMVMSAGQPVAQQKAPEIKKEKVVEAQTKAEQPATEANNSESLMETARKDLMWTIDDPDMGYLSMVEKYRMERPDTYKQIRNEIGMFVDGNYGNLTETQRATLKYEGLKHLDCRLSRSCPSAPKFVVQ